MARKTARFDMSEEQNDGYNDWREYRRKLAYELVHQKGMTQKAVAELLDVTQAAVSQWLKRAQEGGQAALAAKPYPARARKLAEEQLERLRNMLDEGAEAHGFGERWTTETVSQFIAERFEVEYHPAHVSRLLRQWGFVWLGMAGWVMGP